MSDDEDQPWPFGVRSCVHLHPEFRVELDRITIDKSASVQADGSPMPGYVDGFELKGHLVAMMRRAPDGGILEGEYEVVNFGDTVVELKYPRPHRGRERGRGLKNLFGWHYRLFAGMPTREQEGCLVWLLPSRKPDTAINRNGLRIQDGHIKLAVSRFKVWLISIVTSGH